MTRGGSYWPVIFASLLLAGAFRLALSSSSDDVEALRFVRATPRATLAAPRQGPAIYSGTISGPEDWLAFSGGRVAGRWWWVVESVSKNRSRTVCSGHRTNGMRLDDARDDASGRPKGVVALSMFDADKPTSLLASGLDDTWQSPLQIDLGDEPASRPTEWSEVALHCQGSNRSLVTRSIPEGARADVLGCFADGKLESCATNPAAILSLGGIDAYSSRREFRAAVPFLFAAGLAWILLLALTVGAYRLRARTLGAVVPEVRR